MRDPGFARRSCWRRAAIAAVALILAIVDPLVFAQDEDLPGRVGRLAELGGRVMFSTRDRPDEWEPVGTNYPITSGANLWVSSDGRAEIDYGGGQFRLAGDTNANVTRLDDRQLVLFVAQGRVIVRVRSQDPGEATFVDTPGAQLTLLRPGLYRIDVAPDRQATTLTVREGEATVALPNEARQVLAGQAITIGANEPVVSEVRYAQAADAFDTWSANRDRGYEGSRTSPYVSRQMVGAADLDRYGAWQSTREYGPVWFPYAAAPDWAPYSDGYWVDIGGWGPTWVDSAPWGYAPFHYGRWAFIGGRWGWCPGGYVARPVWAPALVAWYGGPGWGVAVSGGRPLYGWVPLGWREPYYPGWRRCSANCWARFNRPYGINVNAGTVVPPARHVNLAVPGALSAVPAATLASRAAVRSNRVSVPGELASSARAMAMPAMRMGERQVPTAPSAMGNPPRAASTYTRVPRAEAATSAPTRPVTPVVPPNPTTTRAVSLPPPSTRIPVTTPVPPMTSTQGVPARPTTVPPSHGTDAAASSYAPRRGGPPPADAPQRPHARPAPATPSVSPYGAAPAPSPPVPASVAPRVAPAPPPLAPSAPSQPAPPPAAGAARP